MKPYRWTPMEHFQVREGWLSRIAYRYSTNDKGDMHRSTWEYRIRKLQ